MALHSTEIGYAPEISVQRVQLNYLQVAAAPIHMQKTQHGPPPASRNSCGARSFN